MASIRARRSIIESTDFGSGMNPDLAVVIEVTLALTAQAINKANDEEPRVTHSDNKENCDDTSVYKNMLHSRTLTR